MCQFYSDISPFTAQTTQHQPLLSPHGTTFPIQRPCWSNISRKHYTFCANNHGGTYKILTWHPLDSIQNLLIYSNRFVRYTAWLAPRHYSGMATICKGGGGIFCLPTQKNFWDKCIFLQCGFGEIYESIDKRRGFMWSVRLSAERGTHTCNLYVQHVSMIRECGTQVRPAWGILDLTRVIQQAQILELIRVQTQPKNLSQIWPFPNTDQTLSYIWKCQHTAQTEHFS